MKIEGMRIFPILKKDKWLLAYLFISFLFSMLFVLNKYPPFQDYPNHLLEAKVIAKPGNFAPYYEVDWKPVPNITNQIFLAALSHVLDVNIAGRLYCILYIFLFGTGAYLFSKAFLNKNYLSGLSFFLFISNFFFWRGYMNYFMGFALCLNFLAVSHVIAQRRSGSSIALDSLFAILLYFTHALTAGVFILFKLIFIFRTGKRRLRYVAILLLPVAILSALYIFMSSSQAFSWNYGTGMWKITSLKRLVAIPYISSLTDIRLFDALNAYNAVMYLWFIFSLVFFAFQFKRIDTLKCTKGSVGGVLILLLIIYLILPFKLGEIEVDSRISFFLVVLLLVFILDHFLRTYDWAARAYRVIIVFMLGLNFTISFLQFSITQQRLDNLITSFQNSTTSREDVLYVSRKIGIDSLAEKSHFFQFLERCKLHTDLTQVIFMDEHLDSYFYLDGGYPRKLFTYSIIKKMNRDIAPDR